MAEGDKKGLLNNAWFQLIIGALVFSPIGNLIGERFKDIPVLSPILSAFTFVWLRVLNFKIPLWIIGILLFIIYYVNKAINRVVSEKVDNVLPHWLNWKQDRLKNWNWSWEYQLNGSKYIITNLRVICDKCNFKMSETYSGHKCPKCDNQIYNVTEFPDEIHDIISQKIMKDDYPKG